MKTLEKFLRYITFPTQSSEENAGIICPTTENQFNLAGELVREMREMGIDDAFVDEKCYVYGHIPASSGYENCKKIGFISHMDTSPDFADSPVNVQMIENYDGGDVPLGKSGRVITNANFPHLKSLAGRTLITTDGETLLGADDKAGIAEILAAAEEILTNNIPHGPISICFTPDEEVGTSADLVNLKILDADFAYTVDGGVEGEVVYETFNAASAIFEISGYNIHPGSAKNRMINASLVAMEINSMLPSGDTPRDTEGYEGFYHLCDMSGSVETAKLSYIVRDHSRTVFDARLSALKHIEKLINEKYGDKTVCLTIKEQYRNMEEMIRPHFEVVEAADHATIAAGLTPVHDPIRGGTDGARLSYMGLPTPNLGTGGFAYHGPYEHITKEGLELSTKVIMNIISEWSRN